MRTSCGFTEYKCANVMGSKRQTRTTDTLRCCTDLVAGLPRLLKHAGVDGLLLRHQWLECTSGRSKPQKSPVVVLMHMHQNLWPGRRNFASSCLWATSLGFIMTNLVGTST